MKERKEITPDTKPTDFIIGGGSFYSGLSQSDENQVQYNDVSSMISPYHFPRGFARESHKIIFLVFIFFKEASRLDMDIPVKLRISMLLENIERTEELTYGRALIEILVASKKTRPDTRPI